jgi:hypothetical protein
MKTAGKIVAWTLAIGVALALLSSLLLLIAAQFTAEASHAVINLGDIEIAVHGLFDQSVWTILGAWLIVGCALFVSAIAVAAAIGISVIAVIFALVFTVASLGAVAVLLASPLIAVALVVWLIVRHSSKSGTPTPPASPSAAA